MNATTRYVYVKSGNDGIACIKVYRTGDAKTPVHIAASFCSPKDRKKFSKKRARELCDLRHIAKKGKLFSDKTQWDHNSQLTAYNFLASIKDTPAIPTWWEW